MLDEKTGEVETIRTDRIVLATGGCGKVYLYTTNPDIATGDGVAMAWRAGAVIANMEFIQFHPTCLFHPKAKSFLISEAVRGEGGILRNDRGEDFMARYHPQAFACAARCCGARDRCRDQTLGRAMRFSRYHAPASRVFAGTFPAYLRNLSAARDRYGETTDPGCAGGALSMRRNQDRRERRDAVCRVFTRSAKWRCTGLHGANRLASNSLLEGVVVAHRACEALLRDNRLPKQRAQLRLPEWESGNVQDVDELVVIYHNWDEIRRLMWDYVGIVRTDKRLQRAAARLRNLQREIREFYWNFKVSVDLLELRNLATVAALIVDSAPSRERKPGTAFYARLSAD